MNKLSIYSTIYMEDKNGLNVINLARALQLSKQGDKAEKELESHLSKYVNDNQVRMLFADLSRTKE
jgi:hypothetical protein